MASTVQLCFRLSLQPPANLLYVKTDLIKVELLEFLQQ